MIERDERNNVCIQETIHQPAIEVHSLLIDLAAPGRQNPRPGNGKAVSLQPQLLHQADIFFPQAIMIVCHIPGIVVPDFSWGMCEPVPGRFSLAVPVPGAFDLVGSGRRTPDKIFRKVDFVCHAMLHSINFSQFAC